MFALLQNYLTKLERDHIKRLQQLTKKRKTQMKKP